MSALVIKVRATGPGTLSVRPYLIAITTIRAIIVPSPFRRTPRTHTTILSGVNGEFINKLNKQKRESKWRKLTMLKSKSELPTSETITIRRGISPPVSDNTFDMIFSVSVMPLSVGKKKTVRVKLVNYGRNANGCISS